jgi:3-carboxy-cis,cis-muconate cycloisomerase
MVLPQIVLGAATAARRARVVAEGLRAVSDRMAAALGGDGLIFAEGLSFALAARMPRPEAQAAVKRLAAQVRETGTPLPDLARAEWPDLPADLFAPAAALGTAPDEARAFARAVRGG